MKSTFHLTDTEVVQIGSSHCVLISLIQRMRLLMLLLDPSLMAPCWLATETADPLNSAALLCDASKQKGYRDGKQTRQQVVSSLAAGDYRLTTWLEKISRKCDAVSVTSARNMRN